MAEFFTLAFLAYLYFLPSIIGRKKRNAAAIIWLNLLGGWTGLGWLVALVWAASKETPTAVVPAPVVVAPVATRVAAPVPAAPAATRVAGPVKALAQPAPVLPVAPTPAPVPVAKPAAISVAEELERLFNLKEKGALTEQEYNMHKANILA